MGAEPKFLQENRRADRAIPVELQRYMAKRIGATVAEIDSSHWGSRLTIQRARPLVLGTQGSAPHTSSPSTYNVVRGQLL